MEPTAAEAAPQGARGGSDFWEVDQQLGSSTISPGNFLRGIRLMVRSSGGVSGTPTADNPPRHFEPHLRYGICQCACEDCHMRLTRACVCDDCVCEDPMDDRHFASWEL